MNKIFSIFIMSLLLLIGANTIMASPLQENTIISPQAYETITGGNSVIINNGDGTLNISGYTSTAFAVDKIGLTLHLQYLSGGNWYNLSSYSFSNYGSSYVSGGKLVGVTKGYSYRVVAEHTSLYGAINERGQSFSSAIYVP